MISRATLQNARSAARIVRTNQISSSRTLASTSRRWAEVTATQPQDLVERSLKPGTEPDPQLDGYPELPYVSIQKRVAKGWWDQQERKNFNETLHEQEDALSMWSPDVHAMPAGWALAQMVMAFSALAGFGYFIYLTKPERPVAKRSYPYGGLAQELGGFSETPKANPEVAEYDE
ncbi:hypothetical protein QFC22_002148 [Naganishia vaughanmartiniae]|uniref:Uncharacterized protein n=1 Tax=Naganishia vaughanmartiniae TaxID=1424756 RepID=A0ACC2XDT1_9TREE|nr:hypothetical protein QFC22_002148 [Naganishia vaughanmartiniae]